MSTAAKFLLEFQATGDQEIVQKLRDIGSTGQEAATQLETLQGAGDGIEQSLTGIGTAAGEAAGPLEEVGTTTEGLGGIFGEAGGASEEFGGALASMNTEVEGMQGGLTEATTLTEGFVGTADDATASGASLGSSFGAVGTKALGMGGMMLGVVGSLSSLQKAQLRVEKANYTSAKATEAARLAQDAFNKVLATASSNTANIATAQDKFQTAQQKVNELFRAGKQGTDEFVQAQEEMKSAQATLREEFIKGGGAAADFDKAINKSNLTMDRSALAAQQADIAAGDLNEQWLNTGFTIVAALGGIVSGLGDLGNAKTKIIKLSGATSKGFGKLTGAIKTAIGAGGFAGFVRVLGLVAKGAGRVAGPIAIIVSSVEAAILVFKLAEAAAASFAGEMEKSATKLKEGWDFSKLVSTVGPSLGDIGTMLKALGVDIDEAALKAIAHGKAMDKQAAAAKANLPLADQMKARMKELGTSMNATMVETTGVSDSIASLESTEAQAGATTSNLTTSYEGLGTTTGDLQTAIGHTQITQQDFNRLMDEGSGTTDKFGTALGDLGSVYGALGVGTSKALSDIELFNNALGQNTASAVMDATSMFAALQGEVKNLGGGFSLVNGIIMKTTPEMTKVGTSMGQTTASIADQQAKLGDLNQMYAQAKLHTGGLVEKVTVYSSAADEATTATEEETYGLQALNDELIASSVAHAINAKKLNESVDMGWQAAEATAAEEEALAQSNVALARARAVRDSVIASEQQLQAAINNGLASLIEEEAAIRGNIASLRDLESQQQRVNNAYLSGIESIDEWASNLATSAAEERGAIVRLGELGFAMEDLPGHIEPTLENLQAYAEAAISGGEASERFKEISIAAFQDLTSEATPIIQSLADLISNPPEDMGEAWNKALEAIPASVRANLDQSTKDAITWRSQMAAAGGDAAIGWALSFNANFEKGAATAEKIADNNAIKILNAYKQKFPEMASAVDTLIKEIQTKGPQATQAILRGLQEGVPLSELIGKDYGTGTVTGLSAGLDGIPGTIDDKIIAPADDAKTKTGPAGTAAAQAFGEGWLTILTGLKQALDTLPGYINQIGSRIVPPKIVVDARPAYNILKLTQNAMNGLKQKTPPKIGVNIQNVLQNTARAQKAITAVKQKTPPKMGVNIQNILQNTSRAQSAINNVKQRSIPRMGVNIQNALQNVSRVQRAINSVRGRTVFINVQQRAVGRRLVATGFHAEVGGAGGPMHFTAGESGRERVTVEPISTANAGGGTRGGFRGGGGAGGQPAMFRGDVILDGHKVGRVIGRLISENNV